MFSKPALDTADKPSTSSLPTDTNIMNTLLVHESKSAVPATASAAIGGGANSDNDDDSEMEDVAANNTGGEFGVLIFDKYISSFVTLFNSLKGLEKRLMQ